MPTLTPLPAPVSPAFPARAVTLRRLLLSMLALIVIARLVRHIAIIRHRHITHRTTRNPTTHRRTSRIPIRIIWRLPSNILRPSQRRSTTTTAHRLPYRVGGVHDARHARARVEHAAADAAGADGRRVLVCGHAYVDARVDAGGVRSLATVCAADDCGAAEWAADVGVDDEAVAGCAAGGGVVGLGGCGGGGYGWVVCGVVDGVGCGGGVCGGGVCGGCASADDDAVCWVAYGGDVRGGGGAADSGGGVVFRIVICRRRGRAEV